MLTVLLDNEQLPVLINVVFDLLCGQPPQRQDVRETQQTVQLAASLASDSSVSDVVAIRRAINRYRAAVQRLGALLAPDAGDDASSLPPDEVRAVVCCNSLTLTYK